MTVDVVVQTLTDYETELMAILSRFHRSRDAISIQLDDDAKLRQLVIELIDLLNDALGHNSYSSNIEAYYNEGVDDGGPASYASVESIKSVVSAAITHLKRKPELLDRNPVGANSKRPNAALPYPEKVTIPWLIKHVPVTHWISAFAILLAVFVSGIQASKIGLIREILKLDEQASVNPSGEDEERTHDGEPNSTSLQASKKQGGVEMMGSDSKAPGAGP